jgi:hypothetical protein
MRDHLGPNPLYEKEFPLYFRLSQTRVQLILEDLGRLSETSHPFFQSFRVDMFGRMGASVEAKVLLPLKSLAYGGVAPHCFADYFQVSQPMARECVKQFIRVIIPYLYSQEFLRLPTPVDLKNITALHERVHGVPGMVGSLDCMQTRWKNCPIACWQQSFRGRSKGMSTIVVLEAAADYNLWFWHAAPYGFSGALNDGNILALSPLLDRMTNNGTFGQLEEEPEVVPFFIQGEMEPFNRTFFLVYGIYPRYTKFVKAVREPITDQEKRFTGWQESARKDIERAFGVLEEGRFKAMAYPIHFLDQDCIYAMVVLSYTTCAYQRG